MSHVSTTADLDPRSRAYLREVMDHLPPCLPMGERIQRDLRAHLREATDSGQEPGEGIGQMGPPEEVAANFAREADLEMASLADRMGAFLLDLGLGVDLLLVFFVLLRGFDTLDWALGAAFIAASGLLGLLYFPILEERWGQTLGKRLFGLCVARSGGLRLGLGRALIRRLPLLLEFFWLDAAFAPFTEKRQRAFDLVADSVVVRTRPPVSRTLAWIAVLVVLSPALAVAWTIPAGVFGF